MATVQYGFRFRIDAMLADGGPQVWGAAENANYAPVADTALRIRFVVQNTSATQTGNSTWTLYVAKNGGVYAQIPSSASSNPVYSADATAGTSADNSAIVNYLLTPPPSSTFVSGQYDFTGATAAQRIAGSSFTVFEFGIRFQSAYLAPGDYFDFRVRTGTTVLTTYSVTPRATPMWDRTVASTGAQDGARANVVPGGVSPAISVFGSAQTNAGSPAKVIAAAPLGASVPNAAGQPQVSTAQSIAVAIAGAAASAMCGNGAIEISILPTTQADGIGDYIINVSPIEFYLGAATNAVSGGVTIDLGTTVFISGARVGATAGVAVAIVTIDAAGAADDASTSPVTANVIAWPHAAVPIGMFIAGESPIEYYPDPRGAGEATFAGTFAYEIDASVLGASAAAAAGAVYDRITIAIGGAAETSVVGGMQSGVSATPVGVRSDTFATAPTVTVTATNASVSVTGVTAAAIAGSVAVTTTQNQTVELTGVVAAASVGNMAIAETITASGATDSAAAGTSGQEVSVAPPGSQVSGFCGDIGVNISVPSSVTVFPAGASTLATSGVVVTAVTNQNKTINLSPGVSTGALAGSVAGAVTRSISGAATPLVAGAAKIDVSAVPIGTSSDGEAGYVNIAVTIQAVTIVGTGATTPASAGSVVASVVQNVNISLVGASTRGMVGVTSAGLQFSVSGAASSGSAGVAVASIRTTVSGATTLASAGQPVMAVPLVLVGARTAAIAGTASGNVTIVSPGIGQTASVGTTMAVSMKTLAGAADKASSGTLAKEVAASMSGSAANTAAGQASPVEILSATVFLDGIYELATVGDILVGVAAVPGGAGDMATSGASAEDIYELTPVEIVYAPLDYDVASL